MYHVFLSVCFIQMNKVTRCSDPISIIFCDIPLPTSSSIIWVMMCSSLPFRMHYQITFFKKIIDYMSKCNQIPKVIKVDKLKILSFHLFTLMLSVRC